MTDVKQAKAKIALWCKSKHLDLGDFTKMFEEKFKLTGNADAALELVQMTVMEIIAVSATSVEMRILDVGQKEDLKITKSQKEGEKASVERLGMKIRGIAVVRNGTKIEIMSITGKGNDLIDRVQRIRPEVTVKVNVVIRTSKKGGYFTSAELQRSSPFIDLSTSEQYMITDEEVETARKVITRLQVKDFGGLKESIACSIEGKIVGEKTDFGRSIALFMDDSADIIDDPNHIEVQMSSTDTKLEPGTKVRITGSGSMGSFPKIYPDSIEILQHAPQAVEETVPDQESGTAKPRRVIKTAPPVEEANASEIDAAEELVNTEEMETTEEVVDEAAAEEVVDEANAEEVVDEAVVEEVPKAEECSQYGKFWDAVNEDCQACKGDDPEGSAKCEAMTKAKAKKPTAPAKPAAKPISPTVPAKPVVKPALSSTPVKPAAKPVQKK